MDSELHPNRFGARLESKDLIDMAWNVFGGAKHVHDIDLDINFGKIRAARLVENGRELWVDRRNVIPGLLQVLRDSKCIFAWLIFDPDDRDGPRALEELENFFGNVFVVLHQDPLNLHPPDAVDFSRFVH